jgi:hypothetical protein
MASTRNKNTTINYALEQKENKEATDFLLYAHGSNGTAVEQRICGYGFGVGRLDLNAQSYNAIDTESFLFGINSTNLTVDYSSAFPSFSPQFKCLKEANLVEKPRTVLMPAPLNDASQERPGFR